MMPLMLKLTLQPCKSLCDHKLGSNIFLPQAMFDTLDFYPTEDTVKRRHVKKVKLPCTMGILVLICACVFASLDWFASDEVHELVKQ